MIMFAVGLKPSAFSTGSKNSANSVSSSSGHGSIRDMAVLSWRFSPNLMASVAGIVNERQGQSAL
jgi:hypothetical protein